MLVDEHIGRVKRESRLTLLMRLFSAASFALGMAT
jgi:demethoxyubiquinone hydroxylase (CLK1/Coq7/Cat5 family)